MALRGTLTHRKTRRLAALLGIPQDYALGTIEALWHVTAEQTIRGDIGKLNNIDIAAEMFHPENDADKLVSALIDAGWIDEDREHRLVVHDWSSHADDATDMKLARSGVTYADGKLPRMTKLSNQERANVCARFGWDSQCVARKGTTGHEKALPVPDPEPVPALNNPPIVPQGGPVAVPNPPKTAKPKQRTAIQQEFDEEWPGYWLRRGKDTAERAYEKARKQASREEIRAGVLRMGPVLLREAQERGHTPLHPSTWLNRGGWLDEVEPALAVPGTYPVRDGPGNGGTQRRSWRGEAMADIFYPEAHS